MPTVARSRLRWGAFAAGVLSVIGFFACGSDYGTTVHDGPGDGGGASPDSTNLGPNDAGPSAIETDSGDRTIRFVMRDFREYDASDGTTVSDFENPPRDIGPDGGPWPGYLGPFDDREIVSDTLGVDQKPVYKNTSGTTLTTHGAAAFDTWFRDVPGTNIHVEIPLALVPLPDGSFQYDSNISGRLYDDAKPDGGRGFFPLDDGTPYQTAFGNQGMPHNFSFTGEIHTEFTYKGAEYFTFRGDDDVWVFINQKCVINLGGIHGPEPASVNVDDLGLLVGSTYPLDFFFAERHRGGSNVLFQTTLALRGIR